MLNITMSMVIACGMRLLLMYRESAMRIEDIIAKPVTIEFTGPEIWSQRQHQGVAVYGTEFPEDS